MNVIKRERFKSVPRIKSKNEFVRKDCSMGILGSAFQNIKPNGSSARHFPKVPRYDFREHEERPSRNKTKPMGPPLEPPRSLKRKPAAPVPSSGSRAEASGGRAPDAAGCRTPRRPPALRYVGSSSRGYSGTRSARSTSVSAAEPSIILAVAEGRGMARGEVGLAAVDLRQPRLVLCQFSDTLLYTRTLAKIHYFNPVEIVVPHTFCEGVQPNQLCQLIKDTFPGVAVTSVQRRHYSDAAGREHVQQLCAPDYSAVYLQVVHKFYALTAAAAVLKYVEYIQCVVFARESLKIEYHSSEDVMIIDVGTSTQLELVQPLLPSAGASCSLLGVLGPTHTVAGIRALRAAVLQPSCSADLIENRLDAVQDLMENDSGLMVEIQDVIKKLADVDRVLLLCLETRSGHQDRVGEAQLNQVLLLKTAVDLVPALVQALASAHSGRLKKMKLDFENPHYKEIADRIHTVIQHDAHVEKGALGSLQRCFAVKPDINGLLDVARRTYSELIEDIQKMVEQLSEAHDLPLRLHQNMLKGFHVVLPLPRAKRRDFRKEDLPDIFIQVQNNGASVSMSTEDLVVLDQQAKESLSEIQKMSNIVIACLLKDLRLFMPSLYQLCENVAELDVLIAMAHASAAGSYVRPELGAHTCVRNGVHPLLDYNSQTEPVPNDIILSNVCLQHASPEHNFTVITGPNMGGKSIYIKQVALIQIMAQMGCFVPATAATLRPADRVFSRVGFNDSVELDASTYVLEMKEMQHILQGLTPTSLVIVDELCRGTCSEEGASVAWAICEELLASEAFTFFTTHFQQLTRLQDLYFNVANLHTSVSEETAEDGARRLVYRHKLEAGRTDVPRYGLALAARTSLPAETVRLAEELADLIAQRNMPQEILAPEKRIERALYELNANVRKEIRKNLPNHVVKQLIATFREENPDIIAELQREKDKTSDSEKSLARHQESSVDVFTSKYTSSLPKDTPKPPSKLIYTSDDNANGTNANNYTSVKSSNELLNTILQNNKDNYDDTMANNNNSQSECDITGNYAEHNSSSEVNRNNRFVFKPNINDISRVNDTDNFNTDNEYNNNGNDMVAENENCDESDVALALTQVLEESSDSSEREGSVDEELMKETVDEINEEIYGNIDIESVILTPPFEFRG